MFNNRKLFKEFISVVKNRQYTKKEIRNILKELPIKVLRMIGKYIIYSDFDGYNGIGKLSEMAYFDDLDRWQKEIFIEERLYKI